MPSNLRDAAVKEMISGMGLTEKTNELAKTLSGGQKRRLSMVNNEKKKINSLIKLFYFKGIAFIGDSKLILLDEPTSGNIF